MGLELVTGYRNRAHITSGDDGCRNASILGTGKYVMDIGEKFSYQPITLATRIIINDGDLFNQGRHMHLRKGEHIELEIDILESGFERNDLIVARYKKNVTTGIEDAELIILTGDQSSSDPQDPTYYEGNIFSGEMHLEDKEYYIEDFPLYRIKNKGGQLPTVEKLFVVMTNLENIKKEVIQLNEDLLEKVYPVGSVYISVNNTNPGNIFGGTWERFANGRTLVGVNESDGSFNTVKKTGGVSSVVLNVNQIPSHNHIESDQLYAYATDAHYVKPGNLTAGQYRINTTYNLGKDKFRTENSGAGQAHTNLQPYITVYYWVRIA